MTAESTLRRLVKTSDAKHVENTERLIHMTNAMEAHILADSVAFGALTAQLIEVNNDLKSLLSSRSFLRGTWFAVGVFGTFIMAVIGVAIAWFR